MTTIVIDAATRDKLRAGGSVFLIDETGAIVTEARAATQLDPSQFIGRWFTDEEVAASLADPRRYTAAEVEQRLRELRK